MPSETGRLIPRLTPEELIEQARGRWTPIATVCLFSGGNDSSVVAHRCREHYDRLLFIDTGTAVPGVEEHVRSFADWLDKPLTILRSGDEYRRMVLEGNGFPGLGQHGVAYIRLKERRIEEATRLLKEGHSRRSSVLYLSGVRRAESGRRANRPAFTERKSAKYVNPLIEWTDEEMRTYREEHELPESDAAALLHRSGECCCGAFAKADEERAMLRDLWPDWFERTIASLEREAETRGIRWCRWGGYDPDGNQAARVPAEAGLLCSSCPSRLFDVDLPEGVSADAV